GCRSDGGGCPILACSPQYSSRLIGDSQLEPGLLSEFFLGCLECPGELARYAVSSVCHIGGFSRLGSVGFSRRGYAGCPLPIGEHDYLTHALITETDGIERIYGL